MFNCAKHAGLVRRCARRIRIFSGAIALLLAFNQIVPVSICAGDQPSKAEEEAIRRMNEQIQELQAKVKDLEAKLNALTSSTPARAVERSIPEGEFPL